MAMRTGKSCNAPNCPGVAHGGNPYCTAHEHLNKQKRNYAREKPSNPFYGTARWKKLRAWYRARNPLCEMCQAEGVITQTQLVDHLIPIEEGGDPMAISNLQALCKQCHAFKHSGKENLLC